MTGGTAGTDGRARNLETDLELVAIAAIAANGVIGADGEMPWHIPADLKHVNRTTTGHPVILGRLTYESILDGLGGPLPDRTSVVLTGRRFETPGNVVLAHDLEAALEAAEEAARVRYDGVDRAFVLGGETIYAQLLPATDRLILTEIHETYEGDTYFPEWDRGAWREVSRDERDGFAFAEYVRRE